MENLSHETNLPKLLKEAGLRVTPQREAILHYLMQHEGHATADQIYQAIHPIFPNLSVSTVYNTMKHFTQAGLIKEITFGDAASRFDININPHHHLVCTKCGQLIDFCLPEFPVFPLPPCADGFAVKEYHLEIKGVCRPCQESAESEKKDLSRNS